MNTSILYHKVGWAAVGGLTVLVVSIAMGNVETNFLRSDAKNTATETNTASSAAFVGSTVPDIMETGSEHFVSLTFANTGTEPWGQDVALVTMLVDGNTELVATGAPVLPGESFTYEFLYRAPEEAGAHTSTWALVNNENLADFISEQVTFDIEVVASLD